MKKNILIINGSITGRNGNTNQIIKRVENILLDFNLEFKTIHLNQDRYELKELLTWAHGFIFTTGTYWDNWGSPMQKFIEEMTEFEATPELLFKPASVIVSMHAFGGKEVLSRLQGILNTMGLMIPPMSGMTYGLAIQEALNRSEDFSKDFWSIDDLEVVLFNLKEALNHHCQFKAWPVDKKDPTRRWINI